MLEYLKKIKEIYFNKQMLVLLALGFSSGFPFLLVFGTLTLWLKQAGLALAVIGSFSLVKIPYSIKWLWSPLIDNIKLPFLSFLGRRRSWAVFIQILLFLSIFSISCINPADDKVFYNISLANGFISIPITGIGIMAVLAFITAFLSASQDIVLDAYRVECFEKNPSMQANGVAIFVLGYRLGLIYSGAGALYMAALYDWNTAYKIMALGVLVGLFAILYTSEAVEYKYKYKKQKRSIREFLKTSVADPFKDFIKNKNWGWILILIFTYHLSNAYFNPVINPFYDDMGFTKIEIANVMKLYGMIAAISGGIVGGLIITRIGLKNGLLYFGILQCLSTMLFSVQAIYGHNMMLFIVVVTVENFISGLATTALVAYVSSLCNKAYTATQYALLSSVMGASRDIFSSTSGIVAQFLGWKIFFVVSAFMSVPSLIIILLCLKNEKKQ